MLEVKNLFKIYDTDNQSFASLKHVDFEVNKGEFFCLLGPSGCGKSTLLRILARLIERTSGSIKWGEKPKIGFVFQNYALFPYLTVWENIEFGLKMLETDKRSKDKIIKQLISELGLEGFEDKHPKELSGGMKQRVGIARALAIDPNVLLLDEPFSSLDEFTSHSLRKLLLDLWATRKITVVMVTHLIREAIELSDRVAIMSARPGTILKILENPLSRPRDLRTKTAFDLEDQILNLIKA